LKNDAFAVIYNKLAAMDNHIPAADTCIAVFENLPQDPSLRTFFINLYTWYWDPSRTNAADHEQEKATLPRELLWEVMTANAKRRFQGETSPFHDTPFEQHVGYCCHNGDNAVVGQPGASSSDDVVIRVRSLGIDLNFKVRRSMTVDQLKLQIEKHEKIPAVAQRLVTQGTQMRNGMSSKRQSRVQALIFDRW